MMSTLCVNGVWNVITPYPKAAAHKCVRLCVCVCLPSMSFGFSVNRLCQHSRLIQTKKKAIEWRQFKLQTDFVSFFFFFGKQQGE